MRDIQNLDFGTLYRIIIAPIKTKILLTSIELKIFNQLSEPKSSDNVAKALHTNPRNTEILLDALAAIDLLHKKKGLYKNSSLTETYLVEDSPTYVGDGLIMMNSMLSLENLLKSVREGQFEVSDHRGPEEVARMITSKGYEPVWKDWDAAFLRHSSH